MSPSDQAVDPLASRRRRRLLTLHACGLIYLPLCALSLTELRGTALGGAVWLAAAVSAVLLVARLSRRKARRLPRFRPVFSIHTWVGLAWIATGAFGVAECLHTELPGTFMQAPIIGAPISRWFFVIAGVFGVACLYGVLATALGSGLGLRPPGEPAAA